MRNETTVNGVRVTIETAEPVRVEVPGRLVAEYLDGRIVGWGFMPHASDAGYFGAAANLLDDDELDVEQTDGPFWTAVQRHLAGGHDLRVGWSE